MADEKVGTKTGKTTQANRDVYETSDGEMVSEKSTTFKYKGKWINVPTIHNGYQYNVDTLMMMLDEGIISPTSMHDDEPSASKAARDRSDNLKFNKGGTPMQRQMELFGDGGLKDEGGMIDSESGNEVPIGGTRKGVRDDIPANISEGEFIFPEDVTRYIGLDKLMQLRQEAKMGLKKMEAMGQMGNSDEATMEDDLPFGMADIIVVGDSDEPMEFADGGFVPVKNYEPGGLTTGTTGSTRVNQGVDNTIVVDDTVANTGTQSATRSLVGETTTIPRTTVKFKDFMGEALIELRQFINEAGNIITLPFRGGVILPSYTIPEGYTAVVTEEAVDTGDEDADAIIEDANNAVKEAREDKDFVAPPATPAVDWNTLSTSELVEETNKITGVSSTIANGIMLFLGPIGAVGYAFMRNEKKNKAAIIAARIAKGGLSAAEVKSLTAAMELLNPTKDLSLLDKTLDFVGGLLGKAGEEISAVKKTSISIEQNVANQVEEDLTGDLGPAEMVSTANNPNLVVPESDTPTALGLQAQLAMNDQTDMRERQSPVDMGITKLDDALFRRVKTPETYAGMRDGLAQDFLDRFADSDERRNEEADNAARRSLNNQVKAGDFDGTILAPGEGKLSTPVSASVAAQTQNAFPADPRNLGGASGYGQTGIAGTYSTPNVDKNGNSHPNAFAVRAANAQIDASAAFAKATETLKNVPQFNSALPGVDPNYKLESAPAFAPKLGSYQKTDADIVAESMRLIDKYDPNANARINDGTSMEFAKASMAGKAASVDPVIEQQSFGDLEGQYSTSPTQVTAPVAAQTKTAFSIPTTTTSFPNTGPAGQYSTPSTLEQKGTSFPNTGPAGQYSTPSTLEQKGIDSTVVGGYDEAGMNVLTPSPVKAPVVIPKPTSIQPTSAAPAASVEKGSNSLYQSFLNLVTPFDNKEYQDGKLIETGSKKDRTARTPTTTTKLATAYKDNLTGNNLALAQKSEKQGYTGSTVNDYAVGTVSDGNSAGVLADKEGKVLRDSNNRTIFVDDDGNQYVKTGILGTGTASPSGPTQTGSGDGSSNNSDNSSGTSVQDQINDIMNADDYDGWTSELNDLVAERDNKYKGGLLSKPKKKTKATTKKRGLAARK